MLTHGCQKLAFCSRSPSLLVGLTPEVAGPVKIIDLSVKIVYANCDGQFFAGFISMKILTNKFFILGNLLLLLIAIPVTLYFVKQQQEVRSKAAPSSKLYFEPASPQTSTQCTDFTVDLMVDPGTNIVSIVDFYITYDETKLNVTEIVPSSNFATTVRAVSLASGEANMSVSVGADVTKAVSTITKVATVKFTPVAQGSAQIQIDSAKSRVFSLGPADQPTENVLSSVSPSNVTIGTDACAAAGTPTVTPGGPTVTPGGPTPTTGALTPTPTGGAGGGGTPTPTPTGTAGGVGAPICTSLTASPSATGSAPFSVLFTGNGNDPDLTGLITKASFTFGDGQTQDVTTGLNQRTVTTQVNHTYQTAGTYPARLILTDNTGAVSSACTQNITATSAGSESATITPTAAPTIAPTIPPTATPTLVVKPTAVPTLAPTGNISQTLGVVTLLLLTIVGGFIFLTL